MYLRYKNILCSGTYAADSRAALLLLMEFLFDPTLWVGLLTLVVLELVLGIDNLVFIAILAKKLPAKQLYRFRHGHFPAASFAFGDELAGGADSAAVHALGAFVFPA